MPTRQKPLREPLSNSLNARDLSYIQYRKLSHESGYHEVTTSPRHRVLDTKPSKADIKKVEKGECLIFTNENKKSYVYYRGNDFKHVKVEIPDNQTPNSSNDKSKTQAFLSEKGSVKKIKGKLHPDAFGGFGDVILTTDILTGNEKLLKVTPNQELVENRCELYLIDSNKLKEYEQAIINKKIIVVSKPANSGEYKIYFICKNQYSVFGIPYENHSKLVNKLNTEHFSGKNCEDKDICHEIYKAIKEFNVDFPIDYSMIKKEAQDELNVLQKARLTSDHSRLHNVADNKIAIPIKHLGNQNLDKVLKKINAIGEVKQLLYATQMAAEVAFYHALGLLHCDVKPENFVLDDLKLSLIDFGHAMEESMAKSNTRLRGTEGFLPPELFPEKKFDSKAYSYKTDCYALGISIGEALGATYSTLFNNSKTTKTNDPISIANKLIAEKAQRTTAITAANELLKSLQSKFQNNYLETPNKVEIKKIIKDTETLLKLLKNNNFKENFDQSHQAIKAIKLFLDKTIDMLALKHDLHATPEEQVQIRTILGVPQDPVEKPGKNPGNEEQVAPKKNTGKEEVKDEIQKKTPTTLLALREEIKNRPRQIRDKTFADDIMKDFEKITASLIPVADKKEQKNHTPWDGFCDCFKRALNFCFGNEKGFESHYDLSMHGIKKEIHSASLKQFGFFRKKYKIEPIVLGSLTHVPPKAST